MNYLSCTIFIGMLMTSLSSVYLTKNHKMIHDVCEQNYIFTYVSPREK